MDENESTEKVTFEKFAAGFAFWRGKSFAKLAYYGILLVVGFTVLNNISCGKRSTTRIEHVDTVIQKDNEKMVFFGIKIFKVGVGAFVE